jgi:hypothetical protein
LSSRWQSIKVAGSTHSPGQVTGRDRSSRYRWVRCGPVIQTLSRQWRSTPRSFLLQWLSLSSRMKNKSSHFDVKPIGSRPSGEKRRLVPVLYRPPQNPRVSWLLSAAASKAQGRDCKRSNCPGAHAEQSLHASGSLYVDFSCLLLFRDRRGYPQHAV